MDYVNGQGRDQMFVSSLNQMVESEAFVRIIDAFVDGLDMDYFGFTNAQLNAQGRPPYNPADLMKLYIYGYQNGVRSCRKLEHATRVNIEVMWLLRGRRPHYKTIGNFRKDNAKAFRAVFRYFVLILKEWKLVEGKEVAVDSFKIRAQNSLKHNYNEAKIHRHLDYIDGKINEYLAEMDGTDDSDLKAEIQEKVNYQIGKWNNYCEIGQQLIQTDEDQISTVDPDAKAVILHRNIVNVGYNVQAVSDGKHGLLVAMDTGTVNDAHALAPMVELARENMQSTSLNVLADKGYQTGAQLKACEDLQATTYVSPKANPVNKRLNVFPSSAFKYHPGTDTYRCPADQIMRSNGTVYQRQSGKKGEPPVKFKHYKTQACKTCPIREHCTSSRNGRVIQRNEHQSSVDRNNRRVQANPDYYRQRQQIIEHQFGTFKRQWGFTHTLVRGKEKVLGEVSLLFTAYNLRRSVSILGFSVVLGYLKTLILAIFGIFTTKNTIEHQTIRKLIDYPDELLEMRWCAN